MQDISTYNPLFLRRSLLFQRRADKDCLDNFRIHRYDVFNNVLEEMRRLPKATEDVFQDLDTEDLSASSRGYLSAVRQSFSRLELDTETILARILPLDPTYKQFAMGARDLDTIRRYFLFLRFRNSSIYWDLVRKAHASSTSYGHAQSGLQPLVQEHKWRSIGGHLRTQTFLAGLLHFLELYRTDRAYLGSRELERYCWNLSEAQISFGLADEGHEYMQTEYCFGSLDENYVHSLECPNFFFPISPTIVLYIMGDFTNAPAPNRGLLLVECGRERQIDVHLRNTVLLHSCPKELFFSSLRSATASLTSHDEFRRTIEHMDFSRLRHRCLQKYIKEEVVKTVTIKGAPILTDLTDEVIRLNTPPVTDGSFSDVWKGEWRSRTGDTDQKPRIVALKVLRRTLTTHIRDKLMKRLKDEVAAWYRLQHPHIANLYGVVQWQNTIGMVSSWCENGRLSDYLEKNPSADRLDLLVQVASGCSYLHDYMPVIVHGDLKGGNILVDGNGRAVITDFGLSRVLEEFAESLKQYTSFFAGSTRWMAPELIHALAEDETCRPSISTASDVYAFACVCLEVATGKPPFPRVRTDQAVTVCILRGKRPSRAPTCFIHAQALPAFWDMLDRCWSPEVPRRPSMGEVTGLLSFLRDTYSYGPPEIMGA